MTDTLDTALPIAVQPGAPDGAKFLPSGNWVVLKDPKQLTRGDKKKIVLEVNELAAIDAGYLMFERIAAKLVTAWSYPLPLPADAIESLDELPIEDDTPFSELIEPARKLLFPGRPDPSDAGDANSPTEASGE